MMEMKDNVYNSDTKGYVASAFTIEKNIYEMTNTQAMF